MRIAIVHWTRDMVGGAETYLSRVIPRLVGANQEVALLAESGLGDGAGFLVGPTSGLPSWSVEADGREAAIAELARWRPDIVYCNGLRDPYLESLLQAQAASVLSAHSYYGTCITGEKSVRVPVAEPCERRFGAACLAHYFPRRCGGLSPLRMLSQYALQARRLDLVRRYDAVVVHSRHMQREFGRHGVSAECIYCPVSADVEPSDTMRDFFDGPARLLFLGRVDRMKGGLEFLDALPITSALLRRSVHLTVAGEGPDVVSWRQRAGQLGSSVEVSFVGWRSGEAVSRLLRETDLLGVPSVLPEPFGLAGLEAAMHGVPAAAFEVGGIPEWLRDGENGALAPPGAPRAHHLAEAIARCLGDPEGYRRLRRGARNVYEEFSRRRPEDELVALFERVIDRKRIRGPSGPRDALA